MRKFFREFRDFIARGNVIDLAVAVIIGGAFSAIVTALTNKIIMPLVNWVLAQIGGTEGLESAYTFLSRVYDANGELDLTKSIYIDWGAFITAVIDFLIIAFVLFVIIKTFNHSRERIKRFGNVAKKELKKELLEEKIAVRKQAKQEGKSFKKAWKEHVAQKEADEKAEEIRKAEEEAKAKDKALQEREELLNKLSSTDRLLYEIKEKLENLENK